MASAPGHPLLLKLLDAVRPVAAVFASTGSHMIQSVLERCHAQGAGDGWWNACGCYATRSSANYFPLHPGLRRPEELGSPKTHEEATRELIAALRDGTWPPPEAATVQYWTVSWIDSRIGQLFLDGLAAARAGDAERAQDLLYATVWSKWGTRFKYQVMPPDVKRARGAYAKSVGYAPDYPFPHYEMGNIHLESKRNEEAAAAFATAAEMQPSSILFRNNLGVAQLNLGRAQEAQGNFRAVLDLSRNTFATIKGMAPEAGANLNLGLSLRRLERVAEAGHHLHAALRAGSYDHARMAHDQLRDLRAKEGADVAEAAPPSPEEAGVLLAEALASGGRTREAAIKFAAAHRLASSGSEEHLELRERVATQMLALAKVWDDEQLNDDAPRRRKKMSKPPQGAAPGGQGQEQEVAFVSTAADGSTETQTVKLTPDMLAELKATGGAGARDLFTKLGANAKAS